MPLLLVFGRRVHLPEPPFPCLYSQDANNYRSHRGTVSISLMLGPGSVLLSVHKELLTYKPPVLASWETECNWIPSTKPDGSDTCPSSPCTGPPHSILHLPSRALAGKILPRRLWK